MNDTRQRAQVSWPMRILVVLALMAVALLNPVDTSPASATVHSSCNIARCSDARAARTGWSAKGFPTTRGWYSWSNGKYNFAGGQFYNREGQFPSGATYYENDVRPRR